MRSVRGVTGDTKDGDMDYGRTSTLPSPSLSFSRPSHFTTWRRPLPRSSSEAVKGKSNQGVNNNHICFSCRSLYSHNWFTLIMPSEV